MAAQLTLLSQLATASISVVGENSILEIESVGGLASSISLTPVRKVDSMVEDVRGT